MKPNAAAAFRVDFRGRALNKSLNKLQLTCYFVMSLEQTFQSWIHPSQILIFETCLETHKQMHVWVRETKTFQDTSRPDRLWGPPSFLNNGYQQLFPWG